MRIWKENGNYDVTWGVGFGVSGQEDLDSRDS